MHLLTAWDSLATHVREIVPRGTAERVAATSLRRVGAA